MNKPLNQFRHHYKDNKANSTLFLLHGTGGTKVDFFFLDQYVGNAFNLVGLEGNVDENGLARFFRRQAHGVFDLDNIRKETKKLSDFIHAWKKTYAKQSKQIVFLGYSNGANMLLATLFYYPKLIHRLVLLHPMLPFTPDPMPDLSGHDIFVSMGHHDQMVSLEQRLKLTSVLEMAGANLSIKDYPLGHEISDEELQDVIGFLRK